MGKAITIGKEFPSPEGKGYGTTIKIYSQDPDKKHSKCFTVKGAGVDMVYDLLRDYVKMFDRIKEIRVEDD